MSIVFEFLETKHFPVYMSLILYMHGANANYCQSVASYLRDVTRDCDQIVRLLPREAKRGHLDCL